MFKSIKALHIPISGHRSAAAAKAALCALPPGGIITLLDPAAAAAAARKGGSLYDAGLVPLLMGNYEVLLLISQRK